MSMREENMRKNAEFLAALGFKRLNFILLPADEIFLLDFYFPAVSRTNSELTSSTDAKRRKKKFDDKQNHTKSS
jgi:hypothetical protein